MFGSLIIYIGTIIKNLEIFKELVFDAVVVIVVVVILIIGTVSRVFSYIRKEITDWSFNSNQEIDRRL